jgi:small conductance mechanosensitive channel
MEMNPVLVNVVNTVAQVGLKIIAALVLYLIGRWLINFVIRLMRRGLASQHVDPTLLRYLGSIVSVLLNIVLAIAILGYFGVETTTFAALIAAAGVAIGVAWSGLLANFAAGVFLVILRPFKVGDVIAAGGVTGTVREIGLFSTTINTPDNVLTYVGNNRIFSDNIQNFSANPYRRVDRVAQLDHSVDPQAAIQLLKTGLRDLPHILSTPPPDVEILEFNLAGPVLAVRPYCHPDQYWEVYFATNQLIRATFGKAGYPVPKQRLILRSEPQVQVVS